MVNRDKKITLRKNKRRQQRTMWYVKIICSV